MNENSITNSEHEQVQFKVAPGPQNVTKMNMDWKEIDSKKTTRNAKQPQRDTKKTKEDIKLAKRDTKWLQRDLKPQKDAFRLQRDAKKQLL